MIGAIAGDVIGSVHEGAGTKTKDFPLFEPYSRFTDDSVLTVAVAQQLLLGDAEANGGYTARLHEFFHYYPQAGYGGNFIGWALDRSTEPYNSWGNGSAMRVSPIAWARDSLAEVIEEAARSAAVTHNHPEGVTGAQAVALAVFMARRGSSKADIRDEVSRRFHYDLHRSIDDIRPHYAWSVACRASVPQAIVAFLDSTGVESAIRLAVSLGGDADTQAAIAGGIAEAFYGEVPEAIVVDVRRRLPAEFIDILDAFERAFPAGQHRRRS